MLLVIGAQAAVVRAAPFNRRIVVHRHLRFLDEYFAAASVIFDVIRNEHSFGAVFRAALEQKHFVVLKDNFAFQLAKTRRANRQRDVIKHVRPHAFHYFLSCSGSFLKSLAIVAADTQVIATTQKTTPKTATRRNTPLDGFLGPSKLQVARYPNPAPTVRSTAHTKAIKAGTTVDLLRRLPRAMPVIVAPTITKASENTTG